MTEERPGEWPVSEPADLVGLGTAEPSDEQGEQHLKVTAGRALWVMPLESIRVDLAEQPTETSVWAATRRWCNAITAMADEIAKKLRSD